MVRTMILLALVMPAAGCDDYCSDACDEPPECIPDEYWRNQRLSVQVTWGSGGHLVTWVPGDSQETYAAVIAADGTVGGTHALGWAPHSRAAATASGYALVRAGDQATSAVRFLDLDTSGEPIRGWRTVATAGEVDPYDPRELAVAAVGSELWVAWWSHGSPLAALRLVRLTSDGEAIDGGGPRIIAETSSSYLASIDHLALARVGDIVWVAWDQRRDSDEHEIHARRIALDGSPLGQKVTLLSDARSPELAARGGSGLLVASRDGSPVALPIDSSGPTAAEPVVVTAAPGTQLELVPSADPSGYLLLAGAVDELGPYTYPCDDCTTRLIPVADDGTSPMSPLVSVDSAHGALAVGGGGYGLATVTASATDESGITALAFRPVAADGTTGAPVPLAQSDASLVRITCD